MRGRAFSFRRRLGVLLTLLLLAMAACIGLSVTVANRARLAAGKLTRVEIKAAPLAREFGAALDELEGVLAQCGHRPAQAEAAALRQKRDRLARWVDQRTAEAHTATERGALDELAAELRTLSGRLDALALRPAGLAVPPDPSAEAAIDASAGRLRSLAEQFARAHDQRASELLDSALDSVRWLRVLVFVSVGLLAAAIAVVGGIVYRDLVQPLREQLVESEVLLAQREKLAALGTLAAGVAHEIRNPLTAIKARLHLLRRMPFPDDAREDIRVIAQEIDRLDTVVRTVLNYARPAEPTLTSVDLGRWLREFADFVRPELAGRRIELSLGMGPAPVEALADPAQLRQILLNLVRNAQEAFAGRPGKIVLGLARGRAELRGGMVETAALSVADNGPGIPADVQARLFDPFFTTKTGGTGLGLSTVARLVDGHGGRVVFQTGPDRGSRFTVHLPIVGPSPTAPAP